MPVIFQHIPFFLEKPNEPDQYFNIPMETRLRVLALAIALNLAELILRKWRGIFQK